MSTVKRHFLLFALFFCILSFTSFSDKVCAYEARDDFYPYNADDVRFRFIGTSSTLFDQQNVDPSLDDKVGYFYLFGNPDVSNIQKIAFTSDKLTSIWGFPFAPEVYDYYFIGVLYASCNNTSLSTFFPGQLRMFGYDANSYDVIEYNLSDLRFYDYDMDKIRGFSWAAKVDFAGAGCSSIRGWEFLMAGSALGSKPADQFMECGILQVKKGSSDLVVDDAITDAILNASDSVVDAINEQYTVDEGEDLGVTDIVQDVEQNLGVLGFTSDVFSDILGLFDPDSPNLNKTTITLPSFSIPLNGTTYKVWDDFIFDFGILEQHFGFAITAIRGVLILCFYLLILRNVSSLFKFIFEGDSAA